MKKRLRYFGKFEGLGTDVTQTKITSYRRENFFSVGRTDLAVVILETSELTLSYKLFRKRRSLGGLFLVTYDRFVI